LYRIVETPLKIRGSVSPTEYFTRQISTARDTSHKQPPNERMFQFHYSETSLLPLMFRLEKQSDPW